jgi:hypothetical protein
MFTGRKSLGGWDVQSRARHGAGIVCGACHTCCWKRHAAHAKRRTCVCPSLVCSRDIVATSTCRPTPRVSCMPLLLHGRVASGHLGRVRMRPRVPLLAATRLRGLRYAGARRSSWTQRVGFFSRGGWLHRSPVREACRAFRTLSSIPEPRPRNPDGSDDVVGH